MAVVTIVCRRRDRCLLVPVVRAAYWEVRVSDPRPGLEPLGWQEPPGDTA